MMAELPAAGVNEIKRAVATSPIVARRSWLEVRLADWRNTRRSPDVDEVILAWLASHASTGKRFTLS